MVQDLFGSTGAAQDETVFKFANDVNVDQIHRDRPDAEDAGRLRVRGRSALKPDSPSVRISNSHSQQPP